MKIYLIIIKIIALNRNAKCDPLFTNAVEYAAWNLQYNKCKRIPHVAENPNKLRTRNALTPFEVPKKYRRSREFPRNAISKTKFSHDILFGTKLALALYMRLDHSDRVIIFNDITLVSLYKRMPPSPRLLRLMTFAHHITKQSQIGLMGWRPVRWTPCGLQN